MYRTDVLGNCTAGKVAFDKSDETSCAHSFLIGNKKSNNVVQICLVRRVCNVTFAP